MDPKVDALSGMLRVQYMKTAGLSAKRVICSANGSAPGIPEMRSATVFRLALPVMSYGMTNHSEHPEKATGWDFSYLERTRRMVESPLPWNYYNELLPYLRTGIQLLDMGTGGGEFLSLLPAKERYHIYATEGFADNIPVARERLATFGATLVSAYEDDQLPFEDTAFDLVINRHESYSIDEVWRILKPGGCFITQQVDGVSDRDIADKIGHKASNDVLHWNLAYALQEFIPGQLDVFRQEEHLGYTRFYDAEALIFYIRSMPYLFEDSAAFDYDRIRQRLGTWFGAHPFLDITNKRFLICARKQ